MTDQNNNIDHISRLLRILLCHLALILLMVCSVAQAAESNEQATNSSSQAATGSAEKQDTPTKSPSKPPSEWDKFVPPRDEKFDWIQLTSGEWLKGELNFLYNYSLEFDSDELDLQKFDWEDIKQIRSAGYQSVLIETGPRTTMTAIGLIELVGDKLRVTADDQAIEFDRDQIISIAKGSSDIADLWSGKIALGINVRSGNSELVDSNFTAYARRRTSQSRVALDYVGNFSKAEGVETSNNHRFNAHYDIFKTSKYFWRPVFAEYVRDRFKNINNQVSLGTAFGYHIIRNSKTEWEISGGVGALYKQFVSVEAGQDSENTSPALGLGTRYETDITSWLEYLFDFSFQIVDKEAGTYIHHLVTTLESDLLRDLDLDISIVWDRVEDPQPAEDGTVPEQDDFQLIVGVSYEF